MRIAFLLYFLTFVLAHAEAAPETAIQVRPIQTRESQMSSNPDEVQKEALQVTRPPDLPTGPLRLRKISNAANNVGIGTGAGQFQKTKETESITTLNAFRTQYNSDESAQEFGVSVSTNQLVGVHLGYKTLCCFTTFASSYEPFYKVSIAGLYLPKDALGNVIDYKRYFFEASVGFENLFSLRRSWKLEIGARSGYPGSHVFGVLSYSFPE